MGGQILLWWLNNSGGSIPPTPAIRQPTTFTLASNGATSLQLANNGATSLEIGAG